MQALSEGLDLFSPKVLCFFCSTMHWNFSFQFLIGNLFYVDWFGWNVFWSVVHLLVHNSIAGFSTFLRLDPLCVYCFQFGTRSRGVIFKIYCCFPELKMQSDRCGLTSTLLLRKNSEAYIVVSVVICLPKPLGQILSDFHKRGHGEQRKDTKLDLRTNKKSKSISKARKVKLHKLEWSFGMVWWFGLGLEQCSITTFSSKTLQLKLRPKATSLICNL